MTRKARTDTRRKHTFTVDIHLSRRHTHRDAAKILQYALSWLDLAARPVFSVPDARGGTVYTYANRVTVRGVRGANDAKLALVALDSYRAATPAERDLFTAYTAPARAILEQLL